MARQSISCLWLIMIAWSAAKIDGTGTMQGISLTESMSLANSEGDGDATLLCLTLGMEGCQTLNQSLIPRGREVVRVIGGRRDWACHMMGRETGQLIGRKKIRYGEGPPKR